MSKPHTASSSRADRVASMADLINRLPAAAFDTVEQTIVMIAARRGVEGGTRPATDRSVPASRAATRGTSR